MERGFVLWFTGLPASGKTTVASIVKEELQGLGRRVELLDGDVLRRDLDPEIGFSPEDRAIHIRRVAYVSELLARNGVAVLVCLVSPYIHTRASARELVGDKFIEVYVRCSLETCISRDPKGLYRRALAGEIPNMTGIGDPYEEPPNPDVVVDTEENTAEENAAAVLAKLRELGYI
ncbi:MAG: adenylyl-sulfate kinase [Candidatus Bathyarchaeota archaeon]|nr:adenylyl-sulfate kinase [Candidatus Bathyarchaeota archaeon]